MRQIMVVMVALLSQAAAVGADEIDDFVRQKMEQQHIPGASIAVVKNGEVLRMGGYGLANIEQNTAATADTVYQLQSITKTFVATGLMLLEKEGKLSLDDPLGKYLDGTPELWKDVTIRRLMCHTTGIKDYINEPTQSLRLEVSDQEVFKVAAGRELNFPAGTKMAYSNTGYHLLGMVIAKITGKKWGDFLAERIFIPLGMDQTRIISWSDVIPNRAAGYRWDNGRQVNGEYIAISVLSYAGGGVRSTARDMAKWAVALHKGTILDAPTLERMWTKQKLADGKEIGCGLAWFVAEQNGQKYVNHSGAHSTGFTTIIQHFPEKNLTVIVLTNQNTATPKAISEGVAGLVDGELRIPVRGNNGI
jgi:D-alanyl-D-alanine carboxypeptidase